MFVSRAASAIRVEASSLLYLYEYGRLSPIVSVAKNALWALRSGSQIRGGEGMQLNAFAPPFRNLVKLPKFILHFSLWVGILVYHAWCPLKLPISVSFFILGVVLG